MHRDCLERWIQRTMDPQCQVCQFRFTVRKQPEKILVPAFCEKRSIIILNANLRAAGMAPTIQWRGPPPRAPVHGLGVLFLLASAFVFTLAWLYAVSLVPRVGEKLAATVVVFLAVQNMLWFYFPFVSFRNSYRAYKKWREETATLKLVLNTDPPKGAAWPNFSSWRSGGGSREPVLADGGAQ
ncbi:hypothetical protein HPB50_028355 [Hyalomma asiaticum]|nr:hypothetical protein HPB50_028355 [Hyalomma asiaticum]